MSRSILYFHNIFLFFFSLIGVVFGLAVSHSIYPITLYSLIFSILLIALLSLYKKTIRLKGSHFLVFLILTSLSIKILSVFLFENLMINITGMPFLSYNDDYVYNETSSNILKAWHMRGFGFYNDVHFSTGFYSGYPNISALAKFFFGDHYLIPRFLNVFFSTLTLPFAFLTLKHLGHKENQIKLVTLLIAFSPIFITYSSLQLKDTILIFFVATLIYGTVNFLKRGISLSSMLIIAFSMAALLFFRAAILLAYLVPIVCTMFLTRSGSSYKLKNILWVTLILICFYSIWQFMHSTGLLALTGEEYLESRFAVRGESDVYQGTTDLGKLGLIATVIAPLLGMLSLFLPTPVYLDLDPLVKTVPYHYFSLIGYYAILPMALTSLLFIIKNYRLQKVGFFLVSFLILYKLGQVGSKSIFDSRQSLPAIYIVYLLLGYFDLNIQEIKTLWKRYYLPILFTMLLVMFFFTYLRYLLRS